MVITNLNIIGKNEVIKILKKTVPNSVLRLGHDIALKCMHDILFKTEHACTQTNCWQELFYNYRIIELVNNPAILGQKKL